MKRWISGTCLALAVLSFESLSTFGEPGVTSEKVLVGMSTALSGPTQALGSGVKAGVEACFEEVNAAGGIHGRRVELLALDDGYEPTQCGENMRKMIETEEVFSVIGNVGTPTAIVAVPIANEKKTVLFGAFTGAGVLRKSPPDRYIFNYRASYAEETAAMVGGFIDDLGFEPNEIAFFTQNDGYGDAGFNGAVTALKAKGFADAASLAHGRYERNTTNIEDGLLSIMDAEIPPKAIIMVGAYRPCAAFIQLAKDEGIEAIFANVSFVGSKALAAELGDAGEGVVVTQVVPHYESDLPGVAAYRESLSNHGDGSDPGFVSLEGYLSAKIFCAALEKAGKELTKEGFVDACEQISGLDIGIGQQVSFSPTEHQAVHKVWPTVIEGGQFKPLNDWSQLAR